MRKYWVLFKSNLSASLEYRGALFTWILVELVGLTSAIFIWLAVFRTNTDVGNYDFNKIISYFILVPVIGSFTSIFVSEHLPKRIKDGQISTDLLKPYSIASANLINQFSIKLTQMTIKLPVYLVVVVLLGRYFRLAFDYRFGLLALVICVFAYLLHFFIDLSLSYTSFWFDDVWSLSLLKTVALMVFGGQTFPLDLVPAGLRGLFTFLPFRFIYFFPVKVAQGDITFIELVINLGQLFLWMFAFYLLSRLLWKRGVRKYSAYGN